VLPKKSKKRARELDDHESDFDGETVSRNGGGRIRKAKDDDDDDDDDGVMEDV
jgi:hypothetical protein